MNGPSTDIDLVELSGLVWGLVEGEHEAEGEAWVALRPVGWPPIATVPELRVRLEEIVHALAPPGPGVSLWAVAAVMVFLAGHPDRGGDDR